MQKTDYSLLCRQMAALLSGVENEISNLANASALLWQALPDINWAGFYLMRNGQLELGPFQGKPACTVIAMGKGVCGTAAEKREALWVPNVHAFPGHIACDCASNAEVVIPLHRNGEIYGVMDIDSPTPGGFSQEDFQGLQAVAAEVERGLFPY
ncbi:MAG TPA: GAF domain-containing protein [Candidatus Faecousia intestinigallinarum]|nr:GAF domain-containing protein [Candidatus Faecousia intestinigallinarum]